MDIGRVLVELRDELNVLNAAIASLERLQRVEPPKKGADFRKLARPIVRGDGVRAAGTRRTK